MLTNSLSLDEEEAVQAELRALQQETVSSFIFEIETGWSLIATISYVPRATRKHQSHSRMRPQRNLYLQNNKVRDYLCVGQPRC